MTTASSETTGQADDQAPASDAPVSDAPVELTARVAAAGNRFIAAVDGLELEGSGRTPDAAQNALVQTMRGWLERQDTAGRLAEALGVDHLDEATEIILHFTTGNPDD